MAWVRVVKEFTYKDQRGIDTVATPGEMVDILHKRDLERLLLIGQVCHKERSHKAEYSSPASPRPATKRIGIWLKTSAGYSGGRIHMYQYAWCLADLGAEVFLITNAMPRWRDDYPARARLHILIEGQDKIPPDLDLIVTDSKAAQGQKAFTYKYQHSTIPLICWSFETSNWIKTLQPNYAKRLESGEHNYKFVFEAADLLVANSGESHKWLVRWVGENKVRGASVLEPAINTFALDTDVVPQKIPNRPYALWVGRGTDYKRCGLAAASIWQLNKPFDLVVFGGPNDLKLDTDKHRVHRYGHASDAEKFAMMKGAHMVLAPSLFEGFGMVPGESLAAGTPCVVFDLPVLRQNYGDWLVYAKHNDSEDFKRRVKGLAGEPKRDMTAARDWAIGKFSMAAMQAKVDLLPYHAVKKPSVTVQMICYATPTATFALKAVYDLVDEIRIAYGPTRLWSGYPEGGTLEAIRAMPDPDGKITINAQDVWQDKQTMRQWCCEKAKGNFLLMLDADEIWTGFDKWLEAAPRWGNPRWVNFWHSGKHWVHDGEAATKHWGMRLHPYGCILPHYRWSWWRNTYSFRIHHTPSDKAGRPLVNQHDHIQAAAQVPECVVYHLGHCMPQELMTKKHEFYLARDGADDARRERMRAWHNWKGGGGPCGDGIVEKVTWDLPDRVKEALCAIKAE